MRVVFFGSGEFAVPSLRWLVNSKHEIVAVITQPDRPAGRGKRTMPTPVAAKAEELQLPVQRTEDVNAEAFVTRIRTLGANLGVVIAFGQKLHAPLRSAFPLECVNLHASLLPKFRGAAPIAWSILSGEVKTGVTVFRIVERLDAGPTLVQRETMIGPAETTGELHGRLARIGCDAIDATLRLHEGQSAMPTGTPQDESMATRAPKLTHADGLLRFDEPAEAIVRRCRAMWPWPGARCRYVSAAGKREEVVIVAAAVLPSSESAPVGTVRDSLTVTTADGSLAITSLQPSGKRPMAWRDFVNGRHVRPGDRFESMA